MIKIFIVNNISRYFFADGQDILSSVNCLIRRVPSSIEETFDTEGCKRERERERERERVQYEDFFALSGTQRQREKARKWHRVQRAKKEQRKKKKKREKCWIEGFFFSPLDTKNPCVGWWSICDRSSTAFLALATENSIRFEPANVFNAPILLNDFLDRWSLRIAMNIN